MGIYAWIMLDYAWIMQDWWWLSLLLNAFVQFLKVLDFD